MAFSKFVCPHCGANIKRNQSQCNYCGAEIEIEKPEEIDQGVDTEPSYSSKASDFVKDLKSSFAEPVTKNTKTAAIVVGIIMIIVGIVALILGIVINIPSTSAFAFLATFVKVVPITIGAILIIIGISLIISMVRRRNNS